MGSEAEAKKREQRAAMKNTSVPRREKGEGEARKMTKLP